MFNTNCHVPARTIIILKLIKLFYFKILTKVQTVNNSLKNNN